MWFHAVLLTLLAATAGEFVPLCDPGHPIRRTGTDPGTGDLTRPDLTWLICLIPHSATGDLKRFVLLCPRNSDPIGLPVGHHSALVTALCSMFLFVIFTFFAKMLEVAAIWSRVGLRSDVLHKY